MRPIDGDRLKAFLNDTEKTLKSVNSSDLESWDDDDKEFWKIYVHAIGKTFEVTRNAIDRMPTLETKKDRSGIDTAKENCMELKDTVELMNSNNWKDRFVAEYLQTKIRYEKLHKLAVKREVGKHGFDTPQEPKGSPRGWIKLKTTAHDIYINTSKIVALGPMMRPDGAAAPAKAITKIYTVGAEDNPWMVDESIDEVIQKIERA